MRCPALAFAVISLLALAPARAAEPPFEASLLRLAEILGSLHFLQTLCGGTTPKDWRAEMQSLLDAEKPDAERRARFVASFNAGYRAFSASYTTCTPSATAAIALYTKEGDGLTRDLTARFGN